MLGLIFAIRSNLKLKSKPNLAIIKNLISRFSVVEMKRIYRGFKTECPTGLITEEAFHGIYSRFFPQGGINLNLSFCLFNLTHKGIHNSTISFHKKYRFTGDFFEEWNVSTHQTRIRKFEEQTA